MSICCVSYCSGVRTYTHVFLVAYDIVRSLSICDLLKRYTCQTWTRTSQDNTDCNAVLNPTLARNFG